MAKIIQLTSFSGQDGAKQLANHKVRRCDSVIYCKSEAEANCYRAMIEHFEECRKGVDHLYGIIAICVDPTSTMIGGMHLISQRIPNNIKSSWPFQLQAKKIGKENQAAFLEICGLATEKELKAVWERCANRLTFPIEATVDEKNLYRNMFEIADSLIQKENHSKTKEQVKEIEKVEKAIGNWLTDKFGSHHYQFMYNTFRKTWRVSYPVDGNKTFIFTIEMDFSQARGVESFNIIFSGLYLNFRFPWSQDKNITAVTTRIGMLWEQFVVMMEAYTKAAKATTVNITVHK